MALSRFLATSQEHSALFDIISELLARTEKQNNQLILVAGAIWALQ